MIIVKSIIGTCVLRDDRDGCFSSKYFHGMQDYPFVEACKRVADDMERTDPFSENHKTVWIQDNFQHKHANLQIVL